MSHIPEKRLTELGMDPGLTPTEQESDHLARCEQCAGALEEERQLTDLLGQHYHNRNGADGQHTEHNQ